MCVGRCSLRRHVGCCVLAAMPLAGAKPICDSHPKPAIAFVKLHRVGGTTFASILCRLAINYNLTTYEMSYMYTHHPGNLNGVAKQRLRDHEPPLQIWMHHGVYDAAAFRALVPQARGRVVAVIRDPLQRYLSAWHTWMAPGISHARAEGKPNPFEGDSPGSFCTNVSANPDLLAHVRRKYGHTNLNAQSRALLGGEQRAGIDFTPEEVAGLARQIETSQWLVLINERCDAHAAHATTRARAAQSPVVPQVRRVAAAARGRVPPLIRRRRVCAAAADGQPRACDRDQQQGRMGQGARRESSRTVSGLRAEHLAHRSRLCRWACTLATTARRRHRPRGRRRRAPRAACAR